MTTSTLPSAWSTAGRLAIWMLPNGSVTASAEVIGASAISEPTAEASASFLIMVPSLVSNVIAVVQTGSVTASSPSADGFCG
jgi:hypothetical protein